MDFPVFQVPYIGHGMTIGTNAVIHVILSHGIAIGVVFAIALTELVGYVTRNDDFEEFAHWSLTPVVAIIGSFSSITGVGIWFTIGPLAPRAASSMLRIFYWPWFIEWIVFTLEWVILLPYYFRWKQWRATPRLKKLHIALGFAYPLGGLVSAWLITGIIGFQLTPGDWPWTGSFWDAFNNPSLWQQTALRFFGGMALGIPIVVFLMFFWEKRHDFRRRALRLYGPVFAASAAACAVATYLYILYVPDTFKTHTYFALLTSHVESRNTVFWVLLWVAVALLAAFAIAATLGARYAAKILLVPVLLAAIVFAATFERMREFIRGPYVMASYMYVSEVLAKETPYLREHGQLSRMYWYNTLAGDPTLEQVGETLFGHNCNTCHTIGGINDIQDRLRGRTRDGISVILAHTHEMVPWMPPFSGTEAEKEALAEFLYGLTRREQLPAPAHLPSVSEAHHE